MAGKPINPGAYNRRITIQQESPVTSDAFGSAVPAWSTVAQTWASLAPKTRQWTKVDGQPIIHRQAHYCVRRIPSTPLHIGMRVVDNTEADATQTWSIIDMQDLAGARREILLVCQYVPPDTGV